MLLELPNQINTLLPITLINYEDVMTETDVIEKPKCIFNMDEMSCRLSLHKHLTVFVKIGAKRVHMLAEDVTLVICGNALGQAISPLILMEGIRQTPERSIRLPPDSAIQMTEKETYDYTI